MTRGWILWLLAALVLLMGLGLAGGGAWLISLGGSWYYLLAGLALIVCAALLFAGRGAALWVYALILLGSLAWSFWEVGLDWWPLATRGGVLVIVGLLLFLPRPLRRDGDAGPHTGRMALAGSLAIALAVAAVSLFTDPHDRAGEAPVARVDHPADAQGVPPGEWHAYGRTGHGQRWSPLDQITPENVGRLQVAWSYETGDERGRPGDPVETTYEVTPLKIGERLYLCTPHQLVIALDATTGEEIWRFDPKIRDQLALQHLTCRGLSYYPGAAEAGAVPPTTEAPDPQIQAIEEDEVLPPPVAEATGERTDLADLPIASEDAPAEGCGARLFMPTADGRVIALDPESGHVCADFGGGSGQINLWEGMPNVRPGAYYSTSPVVVARGVIVVGGTVLDNVSVREQSGVIRGYDAQTGDLLWAWDPAKPDLTIPLGEGETYSVNSPNSWSISSVDEELGLVYVPMGNQPPDQWGGRRGAAAERVSSSVVALDVETGVLEWVFQTVHHDLWDYDVPSQPSLIDLTIDGETVPTLVQPTKQGEVFVLDRRNGAPLLPVEEMPVPRGAAEGDEAAPTQPVSGLSFDPPPLTGADMWGLSLFDQLACRVMFRQLRYEGRYTPPSTEGTLVYPGNFGVFNWGGVAVDPERQIVLGSPGYLAFVSRLIPREDDTTLYVSEPQEGALPNLNENFGAPFAAELKPFLSHLGLPCQAPPWGYVAAADLVTGEILWMHKNGTIEDQAPLPLPLKLGVPDLGGPVMTAGGVAFLSGTLDYYVRAYDVTTGEQLWEDRLPAGGQATPMTYEGADGRQYLLVVAGGHGSLGTKKGDSIIAYALPAS